MNRLGDYPEDHPLLFYRPGNAPAVARKFTSLPGDCELVAVASLEKLPGTIVPRKERVGIVWPVYVSCLPLMVAGLPGVPTFRDRVHFLVVTCGGSVGSSTLGQPDSILQKRNRGLDAGSMVKMTGNFILMCSSPAGKKREIMLPMVDTQIADIAGAISPLRETKNYLLLSLQTWYIHSPIPGSLPVSMNQSDPE